MSAVESIENVAPVKLGDVILVRTVVYPYCGIVSRITQLGPHTFLHLEDASLIGNTGNADIAQKTGKLDSSYYVGKTSLNLAGILEIEPWPHALKTK